MIPSAQPAPREGFPAALVDAAIAAIDAVPARVPVFAIAGMQGSGKSTLAAQIAARLESAGRRAAILSLDDLYLPRASRLQLSRDVHPLLATRGPPGTHEVALGCRVLDDLRAGRATALPRFDKLADERVPDAQWEHVDRADAVIVEGWCLCVPAEDPRALQTPINALEHDSDPDGTWRHYCNTALRDDYPALWSRLDALWFLQPPGFDVVAGWRWQQEQALARERACAPSMDRAGVERFVQVFERVSRQALRTLPDIADRTVLLDASRQVIEPPR